MELIIHSRTPLGCSLDALQSSVNARLGADGEVTGGGIGIDGWYLYVELRHDATDDYFTRLAEFLLSMKVPVGTTIQHTLPNGNDRTLTINAEQRGGTVR